MAKTIGAQGEVTIKRIDVLPDDLITATLDRNAQGWIISHSESGHHHILTEGEVMEKQVVPAGMKIFYAILKSPAEFIQTAPAPHAPHSLPEGIYEFRIAREFDPFGEQVRQVAD